MSIDYLVIGHVTYDLTADGPRLGGTALYSSLTAQRLGRQVALLTRVPPEMKLHEALPGIHLHRLDSPVATTFENRYRGDVREQVVRQVAAPITRDDIPPAWQGAPIVHLGPIARDVAPSLALCFPDSLVCVTPQGWLRQWDEAGRVFYDPRGAAGEWAQGVDAMVFSAEDVQHDPAAIRHLIGAVPLAVMTQAAAGARVHQAGRSHDAPARATTVLDPTGAGDVFATAFFIRLHETGDPHEAAAFANVVASFSIERPGAEGIPFRAQVDEWRARHAGARGAAGRHEG